MRKKSGNKAANLVAAVAPVVVDQKPKRNRLLLLGIALLLVVAGFVAYALATKAPPASTSASTLPVAAPQGDSSLQGAVNPEKTGKTASYVGAKVCKTCHESEFKAWSGSHHDLAMQGATAATVLGNFADARFRHQGVESSFFKRGDKFMVRTDGPDGKLADYEIAYTFGVYPLQQYLIAFPGGRYQALPIAWDARAKDQGGQRWFHLQPGEKIDHTDPLHWTGRYQNWALQCAECHSTDLKKGYDAASDTYKTTYSEINVACEACHGQGSRHVELGAGGQGALRGARRQGLAGAGDALERGVEIPGERCPLRGARQAGRPRRHEHLRRLPRPPFDAERGRARPARRWRTATAWPC